MDKISFSEIVLPTPKGKVRIRFFCSPQEIRKCTFDREFTFHAHNKSLYTSREILEKSAEQPGAISCWLWPNTTTSLDTVCWPTPILVSGGLSWDREL